MTGLLWTELTDRGVIAVTGPDAVLFLQGLLTADVAVLQPGEARLAALLSPQGKILFDGIVFRIEAGFLVDCRGDAVADFLKRLSLYRLRAKVDLQDSSADNVVVAAWPGKETVPEGLFVDPRNPAMGLRGILPRNAVSGLMQGLGAERESLEAYHQHRIGQGIPEAGLDFPFGDAFPHEANMDRLGGVSFSKGCFVGQEVVSRMQHRGTARTRIVRVRVDGAASPGSAVTADGRGVGTLGSSSGGQAIAMLRLDKAGAALDAGTPLVAGDARIVVDSADLQAAAGSSA